MARTIFLHLLVLGLLLNSAAATRKADAEVDLDSELENLEGALETQEVDAPFRKVKIVRNLDSAALNGKENFDNLKDIVNNEPLSAKLAAASATDEDPSFGVDLSDVMAEDKKKQAARAAELKKLISETFPTKKSVRVKITKKGKGKLKTLKKAANKLNGNDPDAVEARAIKKEIAALKKLIAQGKQIVKVLPTKQKRLIDLLGKLKLKNLVLAKKGAIRKLPKLQAQLIGVDKKIVDISAKLARLQSKRKNINDQILALKKLIEGKAERKKAVKKANAKLKKVAKKAAKAIKKAKKVLKKVTKKAKKGDKKGKKAKKGAKNTSKIAVQSCSKNDKGEVSCKKSFVEAQNTEAAETEDEEDMEDEDEEEEEFEAPPQNDEKDSAEVEAELSDAQTVNMANDALSHAN